MIFLFFFFFFCLLHIIPMQRSPKLAFPKNLNLQRTLAVSAHLWDLPLHPLHPLGSRACPGEASAERMLWSGPAVSSIMRRGKMLLCTSSLFGQRSLTLCPPHARSLHCLPRLSEVPAFIPRFRCLPSHFPRLSQESKNPVERD